MNTGGQIRVPHSHGPPRKPFHRWSRDLEIDSPLTTARAFLTGESCNLALSVRLRGQLSRTPQMEVFRACRTQPVGNTV